MDHQFLHCLTCNRQYMASTYRHDCCITRGCRGILELIPGATTRNTPQYNPDPYESRPPYDRDRGRSTSGDRQSEYRARSAANTRDSHRPSQSYSHRMPEIVDDWEPEGLKRRRSRSRSRSRSPSRASSRRTQHHQYTPQAPRAPASRPNLWTGNRNAPRTPAGQSSRRPSPRRQPSEDGEAASSRGDNRDKKRRKQHHPSQDEAAASATSKSRKPRDKKKKVDSGEPQPQPTSHGGSHIDYCMIHHKNHPVTDACLRGPIHVDPNAKPKNFFWEEALGDEFETAVNGLQYPPASHTDAMTASQLMFNSLADYSSWAAKRDAKLIAMYKRFVKREGIPDDLKRLYAESLRYTGNFNTTFILKAFDALREYRSAFIVKHFNKNESVQNKTTVEKLQMVFRADNGIPEDSDAESPEFNIELWDAMLYTIAKAAAKRRANLSLLTTKIVRSFEAENWINSEIIHPVGAELMSILRLKVAFEPNAEKHGVLHLVIADLEAELELEAEVKLEDTHIEG